MAASCRRIPLVVILGATGTGKSKLAIEIGKKFNGEIISVDSMQVYKELDIVTNKVSNSEMNGCVHHMMSYLSPAEYGHTVIDFRNKALPIIDNLIKEEKVPIIVGGTNYYIESLLWNFLVNKKDVEKVQHDITKQTSCDEAGESSSLSSPREPTEVDDAQPLSSPRKCTKVDDTLPLSGPKNSTEGNKNLPLSSPKEPTEENDNLHESLSSPKEPTEVDDAYSLSSPKEPTKENDNLHESLSSLDTNQLYQMLKDKDLEMSKKIHPHNRRKIIRALEVHNDYGVKISDVYSVQQKDSGSSKRGTLRYSDPCILWIKTDHEVLIERLNKRVDSMLDQGLLEELQTFYQQYTTTSINNTRQLDTELGIFQNIGFKEFQKYLLLSTEKQNTDKGRELLKEGVENLKIATRQYARRQIRWISNRLLKNDDSVPPVYCVDSTDVSQWEEMVFKPAVHIVQSALQGIKPDIEPEPVIKDNNKHEFNVCEICDKTFIYQQEWQIHISSRKHKKRVHTKRTLERQPVVVKRQKTDVTDS